MAWNPFEDIFDGISNFFEGAGSWIGNGFSGFMDMFESGAARRNEDRANQQLQLSGTALQHQIEQDEWSRAFAESQSQFQQEAFNKQFELASKPISTLIADGRANGINPMAALGQNVGSASYSSVSAPNSSVSNPGSASAGSAQNFLPNVLSFVGSVLGTGLSAETSKDVAKINAEAQKDIAAQDNATKKEIASEDISQRDRQLGEQRAQNLRQYNLALQGMDVQKGQLDLDKQKRLDKLFQDLYERSQKNEALRLQYKQLQLQKEELERAISADNKATAAKIFGGICVLAGSILGGPVGAVAGTAIAGYINSGHQIGFQLGK